MASSSWSPRTIQVSKPDIDLRERLGWVQYAKEGQTYYWPAILYDDLNEYLCHCRDLLDNAARAQLGMRIMDNAFASKTVMAGRLLGRGVEFVEIAQGDPYCLFIDYVQQGLDNMTHPKTFSKHIELYLGLMGGLDESFAILSGKESSEKKWRKLGEERLASYKKGFQEKLGEKIHETATGETREEYMEEHETPDSRKNLSGVLQDAAIEEARKGSKEESKTPVCHPMEECGALQETPTRSNKTTAIAESPSELSECAISSDATVVSLDSQDNSDSKEISPCKNLKINEKDSFDSICQKLQFSNWTVKTVRGQLLYFAPEIDESSGDRGANCFDMDGLREYVEQTYNWKEPEEEALEEKLIEEKQLVAEKCRAPTRRRVKKSTNITKQDKTGNMASAKKAKVKSSSVTTQLSEETKETAADKTPEEATEELETLDSQEKLNGVLQEAVAEEVGEKSIEDSKTSEFHPMEECETLQETPTRPNGEVLEEKLIEEKQPEAVKCRAPKRRRQQRKNCAKKQAKTGSKASAKKFKVNTVDEEQRKPADEKTGNKSIEKPQTPDSQKKLSEKLQEAATKESRKEPNEAPKTHPMDECEELEDFPTSTKKTTAIAESPSELSECAISSDATVVSLGSQDNSESKEISPCKNLEINEKDSFDSICQKLQISNWTVKTVRGQLLYFAPEIDESSGDRGANCFDMDGLREYVEQTYNWKEPEEEALEEKLIEEKQLESEVSNARKRGRSVKKSTNITKKAKTGDGKSAKKSKGTKMPMASAKNSAKKSKGTKMPMTRSSRFPQRIPPQNNVAQCALTPRAKEEKKEDLFYEFRFLISFLKNCLDWSYKSARNQLSSTWVYEPPDSKGENGIYGIDYFYKESDIVEYCKRNNYKEQHGHLLDQPKVGTPKPKDKKTDKLDVQEPDQNLLEVDPAFVTPLSKRSLIQCEGK